MRRMPTDEQLKLFESTVFNEDTATLEVGTNLYVDGDINSGGGIYTSDISNTGNLYVYKRGVTTTEWNEAGEIEFNLPLACNVKWIKICGYDSYDPTFDFYDESEEKEVVIPLWGSDTFLHCYRGMNTNNIKLQTSADGFIGQDMAGIMFSAYVIGSTDEENYITLEATQQLPINLVVSIGYTTDNTITYTL